MNTQIPVFEKTIELVPGKIACSIKEFWEDIDTAQRAYCGTPDKFTVRKSRGMTVRDRETLKSALGSSLGVKGFVEIKAKMEAELSKEVEWESSYEVAREFNIIPPKCGWKEIAVYQLVRIYDFRFTERRLFGGERTWSRTLKERTERYSGEPLEEPFNPRCNCPTRPKLADLIGRTKILIEHHKKRWHWLIGAFGQPRNVERSAKEP